MFFIKFSFLNIKKNGLYSELLPSQFASQDCLPLKGTIHNSMSKISEIKKIYSLEYIKIKEWYNLLSFIKYILIIFFMQKNSQLVAKI